jgi:anti-anti-sigma factor
MTSKRVLDSGRPQSQLFTVVKDLSCECTIPLTGEFDIANAGDLDALLMDAAAGPDPNILIDMSQVTFMDCSTLHTLVGGYQRAQRQGATFSVINVPSHIRRLFELTETDYMLDVEPALELVQGTGKSRAARNGSSPPFPAASGVTGG